jgi:hypothetical protein
MRLDHQRRLRNTGQQRWTPIQVTPEGVIFDSHHAVRVAAEGGLTVDVVVVPLSVSATAGSTLDLPVG